MPSQHPSLPARTSAPTKPTSSRAFQSSRGSRHAFMPHMLNATICGLTVNFWASHLRCRRRLPVVHSTRLAQPGGQYNIHVHHGARLPPALTGRRHTRRRRRTPVTRPLLAPRPTSPCPATPSLSSGLTRDLHELGLHLPPIELALEPYLTCVEANQSTIFTTVTDLSSLTEPTLA